MINKYSLVFDDIMIKQLAKIEKNQHLKHIIIKMLNKLELLGPNAGKLLDSRAFIYEIKSKHPPIRLYFRYNIINNQVYVFEFEMKTSQKDQQRIIERIKNKLLKS